ncbi:type II secretion system F family protein [Allosphingosinicella flava]|uniref:Type II secretion system F family protein n=1 Tax=Allosphingosinicella flava TaxID=2771430 RepID=A0A7T2GL96_9SPHN|nr:type II secretion system F family protein [Sphingosinicella flava]QPQ55902.1 type II secretion system F family protein [Sphingosinicella flava]
MPILPVVIFGLVLIGAVVLIFAISGPSPAKVQSRRLEELRERHSRSAEITTQAQMKKLMASRKTSAIDGLATSLMPNPALLRLRLSRTGKNWTLGQYMTACAGIGMFVLFILTVRGAPFFLSLLIAIMAGLGLPHFIVGKMINRRVAQFTSKFPDAIELMVRGLRSGLPISETLGIVASEVPAPVSTEFQNVSDKMKIGRTMEQALQETADRLGTPEFQFFVITLAIQRETGGNLGETLANLSDVLRKRAQMKLKIKAMSSESKASAIIVGALPFIVFGIIFMLNPGYMGGFFSEPRLMIAGSVGLGWMGIGVFIMAKMVSFEI